MDASFVAASFAIAALRAGVICWCLASFPKRILPLWTQVLAVLLLITFNYVFDFVYKALFFIDATILRCLFITLFVAIWVRVSKRNAVLVGLSLSLSCDAARSAVLLFVLMVTGLSISELETMQFLRLALEVGGLVLAIAPLGVIRHHTAHLADQDTPPAYLFAFAFPLAIILVVNLWQLPTIDGISPVFPVAPALVAFIAELSAVTVTVLIVYGLTVRKKEAEAIQLESLITAQHAALLERNDAEEALARVMHDINNHLTCIDELTDKASVEKHVEGMRQELHALERRPYTENATLDIILNEKVSQARSRGVELQIMMDFSEGAHLESVDICAIFGNALDNAIRAADENVDPERRVVVVKSARVASYLAVRITNCYETPPILQNGEFMSTRRGGTVRGFGLRSIEHSLAKYQGTMETVVENGQFSLLMSIPLAKQRDGQ